MRSYFYGFKNFYMFLLNVDKLIKTIQHFNTNFRFSTIQQLLQPKRKL